MLEIPPVGLIGIGLMGEALAHRLIGAGLRVIGFDIDPTKISRLVALGGQAAAPLCAVARQCDPIVPAVFSTIGVLDPAVTDDASDVPRRVLNLLVHASR